MLRRNRSWNPPIVSSVGSLRAVRVADQCLNCLLKIPSQERCRAQLDRYWTGLAVVFNITEMAHWPIFTQTPNLLPIIRNMKRVQCNPPSNHQKKSIHQRNTQRILIVRSSNGGLIGQTFSQSTYPLSPQLVNCPSK